ncbi:MAG: ABC transporter permease subunit [Proteobacteria bacterium]|nr:ABC transporter permease subunit [Pseudomonadota bacterium]
MIIQQGIATTTTIPWTLIFAISAIVYVMFKLIANSSKGAAIRGTLTVLWALSFPVLLLIVLRDPGLDWSKALSFYLPVIIGFSLVGWLILAFVSRPKVGELGRIIGAVLLVIGVGSFAFSTPFVIRFLLLFLALAALAAPTFGGEGAANRKYLLGWIGVVVLTSIGAFVIASESLIEVPGSFFLGGLSLTIVLAFTSIVLSFPLGILLALGRTSTMPIFRLMSTTYIELVRGVPLITWLLVAFLMLPVALPNGIEIGGVMRAIGAMTFFNAAYLAENVRGGLQSIHTGQREASKALGLTTLQETVFITLPQALRAVIPALVGQVIATFKDTSLVTIVGLFDFLHMARQVIPAQSQPFSFLGSIKWTLVFAAAVYWIFTFTFSRVSQRLEKKLGVGER